MLKPTQIELDRIADSIEGYINILDEYMIIQGMDKKTYDESMDNIKTVIKKLRKGKTKNIFNEDNFSKYLYCTRNGVSYHTDIEDDSYDMED